MLQPSCIFTCFPDQGVPISIHIIDLWDSVTPSFFNAIFHTAPFPLDFPILFCEFLSPVDVMNKSSADPKVADDRGDTHVTQGR